MTVAQREAAIAFIRRWTPHLATADSRKREKGAAGQPTIPVGRYSNVPPAHDEIVKQLRTQFKLAKDVNPYLTQALTHSSWAYENRRKVQLAQRQDNRQLAHHGAVIANLVLVHHRVQAVLRRTIMPRPKELDLAASSGHGDT